MNVKLADLFSAKAKQDGGFVWQALKGGLGLVSGKCSGRRVLFSGPVGCRDFGFMLSFSFVVLDAWVPACGSQIIIAKCSLCLSHFALSPSPLASAKAQDKLCLHSLYQNQVTWVQARP